MQVALTTRITPPRDSGQQPFSSVSFAKLDITGCPLTETPKPDTTISDGFNVSEIVKYPWRVSSTSDVTDTSLTLTQGSTKDVSVSVTISRDPGQRSITLQGNVQLGARGTKNLTATSVQVKGGNPAVRRMQVKLFSIQAQHYCSVLWHHPIATHAHAMLVVLGGRLPTLTHTAAPHDVAHVLSVEHACTLSSQLSVTARRAAHSSCTFPNRLVF